MTPDAPALLGPEGWLLLASAAFLCGGIARRARPYRPLLRGAALLLALTALYPRHDNRLAHAVFGADAGVQNVVTDCFGVAWWIVGAWLLKGSLDLVLSRTLFPNDNQPHSRRLFADLASGFIYVIAVIGIMDTVLKVPITTVLATSGVLAIVLGLALQTTLADVFSGLALNIERPFRAGEWITVNTLAEGRVLEINWRATRIRTASNDLIVIPNSVIAKAVVTTHRHFNEPLWQTVSLSVDHTVPTRQVIDVLQSAALGSPGMPAGSVPQATARAFVGELVAYDLTFAIDDFANVPIVQSAVIERVADALVKRGIRIGHAVTDVRLVETPVEPHAPPTPA